MIIEKILGNAREERFAGLVKDYLQIEWYNTHKKIDRKKTQSGMEVGIRMAHDLSHRGFRQGDVVWQDGEKIVVIEILPCRCISVKAESRPQLIKLCYEIGNRHAPFFTGREEGEFLVPYDKPIQVMLEKLGLKTGEKEALLLPEHRISSSHGHTHAH